MQRLARIALAGIGFVSALTAQAHFTDPERLVARLRGRGAVDPSTGALYVVGGRADQVLDLWRLQAGIWQRLAYLPVAGIVQGLAWDPARNRLVASIGNGSASYNWSRLYEWDGATWAYGIDLPGPRAQLLHDPVRNLLLVFGPGSTVTYNALLWAWNGSALVPQPMVGVPSPGIAGPIGFDAVSGRVVVASWYGAVYEWNGAGWTTIPATSPIGDDLAATDPASGRVVYFDNDSTTPAAYTWTGQAFTPLPTAGLPLRYWPVWCGSTGSGALRLVGGYGDGGLHADTWSFTGTNWQLVAADTADPHFEEPLVVATGPGQALAFDGGGPVAGAPVRTARFQNGVWTVLQPATSPPRRQSFALAGDPATGRAFLFGGVAGAVLADFWLWNGSDWQQLPGGPPARYQHTMCYRDDQNRLVMYGGLGNNETWEWDGVTWLQRTANFPPHNGDASLAWHPVRRRSVLTTFGVFGLEVWEWDGVNWFSTNPPTRPSIPGLGLRSAYDPVRERVVVTEMPASALGHAHEWDGAAWRSFAPEPRLGTSNGAIGSVPGIGAIFVNAVGALTVTLTNDFPASVTSFGAACPNPQRRLTANQPWLGTTYTLRYQVVSGLPCLFASGFSNTQYGGVPLPIDLGFVGLSGCSLLVAPDVLDLRTSVTSEVTLGIALPVTPALAGAELFHQAAALQSGFTATSQGLRIVAGSLW